MTYYSQASELSREFRLSLSNGELSKLVEHLELCGPDEATRLFAAGHDAVIKVVKFQKYSPNKIF